VGEFFQVLEWKFPVKSFEKFYISPPSLKRWMKP
jgi:hypothetical protein